MLSKLFCTTPHIIGNKIDEMIPFTLIFIIPYVFWYLMLFIIPYKMYKEDKQNLYKYIKTKKKKQNSRKKKAPHAANKLNTAGASEKINVKKVLTFERP